MYLFLLNPGIPSPDSFSKIAIKNIQKEDRKYFKVCEICNIIVDNYDDVRHCTECNICIKKLDHHCYWTGKCIAKNNYFTFQMLLKIIILLFKCLLLPPCYTMLGMLLFLLSGVL